MDDHGASHPHSGGAPPEAGQIAAFFDCENVGNPAAVDFTISDLANRGRLLIRRAYGDFFSPQLKPWHDRCTALGVEMVQKSAFNARGKNGADMALTIDAMEMLVTRRNINAFALVTSDGDFSQLASRLREHGKSVLVFGTVKCSMALKRGCDEFVLLGRGAGNNGSNDESRTTTTSTRTRRKPRQTKSGENEKDKEKEDGSEQTSTDEVEESDMEGYTAAICDRTTTTSKSKKQLEAVPSLHRKNSAAPDGGRRTLPYIGALQQLRASKIYDISDEKQAKKAVIAALQQFEEKGYTDCAGWVYNDRLLAYMKRLYSGWMSQLASFELRWSEFLNKRLHRETELKRTGKGKSELWVRMRRQDKYEPPQSARSVAGVCESGKGVDDRDRSTRASSDENGEDAVSVCVLENLKAAKRATLAIVKEMDKEKDWDDEKECWIRDSRVFHRLATEHRGRVEIRQKLKKLGFRSWGTFLVKGMTKKLETKWTTKTVANGELQRDLWVRRRPKDASREVVAADLVDVKKKRQEQGVPACSDRKNKRKRSESSVECESAALMKKRTAKLECESAAANVSSAGPPAKKRKLEKTKTKESSPKGPATTQTSLLSKKTKKKKSQ